MLAGVPREARRRVRLPSGPAIVAGDSNLAEWNAARLQEPEENSSGLT
ncbi:hypothetical protein ACQPYK_18030 [Streptosporangium sp. CA-135522]